MKTLDGDIVTFELSLVERVIVTPLAGAGNPNVTGNDADWPGVRVTFAGRTIGPVVGTVFVSENTAGWPTPATSADTVKDPAVPFAVNAGAVAMPFEFVVAVTVPRPPAKVPLGPVAGARNVTVTPPTPWLLESVTIATRGAANGELIRVLCGVPPLAAMLAGAAPTTNAVTLAGA